MSWDTIVKKASPYIVKIETQSGSGTGFLCGYNENKTFCLIATALHVVQECEEWQQSLKIHNVNNGQTKFLQGSDRVIFTDYKRDSAVILCSPSELGFPEDLIPLRPMDAPIDIGLEVGWLGFPAIAPWTLCFFSGCISAKKENDSAYLVDGVAINGVSGGPVMYRDPTAGVQFVGTVSAYHPNRQPGAALPGLLVAQDVSHFHGIIQTIKSMDEARKKKSEIEATQSQPQQSPDVDVPNTQNQK